MSKLSFRARALDTSKPMQVYKSEEIPDMPDFTAINRAVPQMPTGMEKEEETEHHLQRALSAQQVYGTAEALVIPVPDVSDVEQRYGKLYVPAIDFKPPKQYIHVQAFGMDQEIPDYDMDSEDEEWVNKQSEKMEITCLQFEKMLDRLEKGSGQMVVTLHDAKALLKEDDDLTIAVYDYWLNKRLRLQHSLMYTVKTEKRDGSTTNNPYVAFRRRTEKMQTRKNRKNDEVSYEKQLKLRRDLNRALTILEMTKRREKSKKELLKLTFEIFEKRYQAQDWDGALYDEAMAERHDRPSYVPLQSNKSWSTLNSCSVPRKKREYRRKPKVAVTATIPASRSLDNDVITSMANSTSSSGSHRHSGASTSGVGASALVHLPHYGRDQYLVSHPGFSSDEELSPSPPTPEPEIEDDPDGIYAFKRKAGCTYHAPLENGMGDWPWDGPSSPVEATDAGILPANRPDDCYTFRLTSLPYRNCIGYARRRIGRGGRVIFDRMCSTYDKDLVGADLCYTNNKNISGRSSPDNTSGHSSALSDIKRSSRLQTLLAHIKKARIKHYRPASPYCKSENCVRQNCNKIHLSDDNYSNGVIGLDHHVPVGSDPVLLGIHQSHTNSQLITEEYQIHHEALLSMKHQQEEQLLRQQTSQHNQPDDSFEMDSSFVPSATIGSNGRTKFTLDTRTAEFAVSALRASTENLENRSLGSDDIKRRRLDPLLKVTSKTTVPSNGPAPKSDGLSTAPAATVLELNYPLTSSSISSGSILSSQATGSSTLASSNIQLKHKTVTKSTNIKASVLAGPGGENAVLASALGVIKSSASPMLKLPSSKISGIKSAATQIVQKTAVTNSLSIVGTSSAVVSNKDNKSGKNINTGSNNGHDSLTNNIGHRMEVT